MHIKQVIICGFRSYKDQVVVEPFSPQHNIVIGRNGTGKSNFFDAIRFGLLTSQFANLRQDERQALLHEGSGKHVMSAYVEIIFDNRDGRFPVDTEDVTLRRTIGVKKDEFFLNKKHIPKNDVIHLLESAGFSRSNPYYIVQQGKVNALALMKDKDRLVLLKEVAGTRVYEERRVESLKIMHETASRREKIQEVIQYIEERLNELEAEKEELKQYQALDKQKRALEYSMHDKTLQSVTQELDHVEKERMMEASTSDALHEQSQQIERDLEQMKVMTSSKNQTLGDLLNRQKVAEFERTELIQQRYQLELQVKEMEDQVRVDTEKQEQYQRESGEIAHQVQTIQEQLRNEILPEFDRAQATEKQLELQWKQAKHESEALIAKQSHMSQFQNKAERDAFLNEELTQVAELCAQKRGEEKDLQTSIKELQHQLTQDTATEKEFHEELEERRLDIESYGQKLTALKQKRNQIAEERKDKWRAEHELGQEAEQVAQRLHRAEDLCFGTMPQDIRKGLQFIKEQFGPTSSSSSSSSSSRSDQNGIYGPVIELFQAQDDRFCTALDEAAGNTLFHVVVETDEIAAKIMRELDRKKAGRVTFLPLNRLISKKNKDSHSSAPRNDDAMPLLDKITFDSKVAPAMDVVFGKKLLCRDLATCAQYAESTAMDCLTLDGDQVHRRGGLAGGYRDPTRSRVRAHQERLVVQAEHARLEHDMQKIKSAAETADQQVSQVLGEIQKLEWEKNQQLDMYEQLQRDSRKHGEKQTQVRSNVATKTQLLVQVQATLTDFETKHHDLEQEILSTFHSEENAADQEQTKAQLRHWTQQVDELAKARQRHENQVLDQIRTQKHQLESTLNQDLLRREQEMKAYLVDPGNQLKVSERAQALVQHQADYDQVSGQVDAMDTRVAELKTQTSDIQDDLSTFESQSQGLLSRQTQVRQQLSEESQRVEKCLGQRRRLLDKRQDAMQQLRECGSLSLVEVEKYAPLNLKQVMKKLHQVQDRLKKYEHVNKKALDQYVSFHDQRTELLEREKELLDGSDSIQDLIQVLDQRKDEAILRTFKGVSHHFTQVFRELVPTGEGRMLIVRNTELAAESNEDEEEMKTQERPVSTANALETFTGIQIKVNFRGEGDSYLMSQLSGGQKALVALAFIFAIQRCDPAPFYLFDEIDQALDSTHRAAVAALIHRQAHASSSDGNGEYSGAQFITSTFRPEMVQVADQFYGIGHQNKISNVHSMTQDESLEFIANIMAEEEGTVTTTTSQPSRRKRATKTRKLDEQHDEPAQNAP